MLAVVSVAPEAVTMESNPMAAKWVVRTLLFNALSGDELGRRGELTEGLLLAEGSSITPL